MKHTVSIMESAMIPLLQAVIMEQQAEGNTEAAARTRKMLDRYVQRERLRNEALRAGRWPFVVSQSKDGQP